MRKAKGSLLATVGSQMTTPAITILASASVQEAADLMLSKKIRRLPVVDDEGYPVGWVCIGQNRISPVGMGLHLQLADNQLPGSRPGWGEEVILHTLGRRSF